MKQAVAIVCVALLGYLAFVFWQNKHQAPPPPPSEAIATPEPTATPTPPPAPVADLAPAPQKNLAPAGTFYVIQRVTVTTDSGITGVAPGTKVTMVSPGPPMKVSDGQNEFEVQPEQVTNDLDVAARVYYADRNAQAAVNASGERAAQASSAEELASEKAWQAKQQALSRIYAQPSTMQMSTGELDQGAKPVNDVGAGGNFKGAIH